MLWCLNEVGLATGQTVCDPFMGTGSTGVACARGGINFIGVEKDVAYHATAFNRIQRELEAQ